MKHVNQAQRRLADASSTRRLRGGFVASPLGAVLLALTLATLVAHAGELRIEADTDDLLRIDGNGNAILSEGWIVENARQHPWTSELNPRDGVTHLIVRDSGVENVAVLDRLRGNLYLRGNLTENVSNLTASGDSEFVVSDGTFVAAVIDEDGNLDLRGARSEASCGPVRQDLVDQYTDFGYDYFDDHFAPVACYKFVDDESYVNPGNLAFEDWSCQHGSLPRAHGVWQWDETISRIFQAVRNEYDDIIRVTNGFRCPTKNNDVSTSARKSQSKHAYGRAFDLNQLYHSNPTLANWEVANSAAAVGVAQDRIFLYNQNRTVRKSLEAFIEDGQDASNLPPNWTAIGLVHIDSGQPWDEQH